VWHDRQAELFSAVEGSKGHSNDVRLFNEVK
jgi:hypothetical protein